MSAGQPRREGNDGAMVQISRRELWRLNQKAKTGWARFYQERESLRGLQEMRNNVRATALQLREGADLPDISHLTEMFLQLYDQVGQLCDCPVCYETMTKEKTSVPYCGHLVCKDCEARLEECPLCRKKFRN